MIGRALALVAIPALTALALTALPAAARAEPTIWQKTRSPEVFRQAEAMGASERTIVGASHARQELTAFDLKRALATLDGAGARTSASPEALYMTGMLLEELKDYDAARPLFQAAASLATNGVLEGIALFDLAIIAVRNGDYQASIDLYERALAQSPMTAPSYLVRPPTRGLMLANQAEAFMALGQVSRAVEGYRAALASTPSYVNAATTYFSLGVALDRSGDLDGALDAIGLAHELDPDDKQIKDPAWSFVPAYDADWYWGLEALGRARATDDAEAKAKRYAEAIDHFATYVAHAPERDPYVSIARGHLRSIRAEAAPAAPATPRTGAQLAPRKPVHPEPARTSP